MLIGGIVAAVVVVVIAVALLTRRVAHDDVHSVEGYHRSLHTLESINAHPIVLRGDELQARARSPPYPESAVRVASPSTVRADGPEPGSVPSAGADTPAGGPRTPR